MRAEVRDATTATSPSRKFTLCAAVRHRSRYTIICNSILRHGGAPGNKHLNTFGAFAMLGLAEHHDLEYCLEIMSASLGLASTTRLTAAFGMLATPPILYTNMSMTIHTMHIVHIHVERPRGQKECPSRVLRADVAERV